jgi:hypothetical protein
MSRRKHSKYLAFSNTRAFVLQYFFLPISMTYRASTLKALLVNFILDDCLPCGLLVALFICLLQYNDAYRIHIYIYIVPW